MQEGTIYTDIFRNIKGERYNMAVKIFMYVKPFKLLAYFFHNGYIFFLSYK